MTTRELTPHRRLQAMLDGIAYVRRHGMIVEAVGGDGGGVGGGDGADGGVGGVVRIRMPDSPDNANIVGSLHASALFCVAETAAGVAAWCVESDPATMVLVRNVRVGYPRRAHGEVVAEARVVAVADGDATVDVSVTDAAGEVVLDAEFRYAMRRANGSAGTPRP